ncbi:hypothetical protein RI367_007477 [Sorochytrium milnesiophthora]
MTDLLAFDYANPPLYDDVTFYQIYAATISFTTATVQTAMLCFLICRHQDFTLGRASSLLTANMLVANTAFCTMGTLLCFVKIHARSYNLGVTGCHIDGYLMSALAYWALSATLLIAVDRYITIVWERVLLSFQWYSIIAASWAVCVVLAAVPFMLGLLPVIQPSLTYCEHNYYSKDPTERAFSLFKIVLHLVIIATMLVIYSRIYIKVRTVRQGVRQLMGAPTADPTSKSQINVADRELNFSSKTTLDMRNASGALASPSPSPALVSTAAAPANTSLAALNTPAAVRGPRFADDVERATFIRAVAICVVALVSWVPYIVVITLMRKE